MNSFSRRYFLSSAWIAANLPSIAAAQQHANHASQSAQPLKFEFFTPELAADVEAIAEQIIPADETPGARDARVVYFIDRALVTFEREKQKQYTEGLNKLHADLRKRFSELNTSEQSAALRSIEKTEFFELVRTHTVMGFFANPEHGGNLNEAGWKTIGFEDKFFFQPPFGYYDAEK
jgi:gluconate 2-dehydrogenase gamma chain